MKAQHAVFAQTDKLYRLATKSLNNESNMTYKRFCQQENIKENIFPMLRHLESLMKSLMKYIEDKRERFPRLFFLSNE